MWQFLARNKHVAAMLGVLCVAAVVAIVLATKGAGHTPDQPPQAETEDFSNDSHIFSTYTLPGDDRFMPSIGNGHIATNIFSDTVCINGLYNGRAGESHRARIPAYANVRLNSTLTHFPFKPVYSLNTRDAVFQVRVDRDRSIVTQKIYAHRFYTRTIVNQIQVDSKPHADPNFIHHEIWIAVQLIPGPKSEDINFERPVPEIIDGRTVWTMCGKTKEVEDPTFQPLPIDVCVCWTSVPDHLVVPQHGSRVFTFPMTVDKNKTVARNELLHVLQEDGEELFRKHVEPWHQLYYNAGIDIEGNLQLSKVMNAIWYYFLSSLPSEQSYQPLDRFFGLSPGGLARGTDGDYKGHNFWDTEIWMYPTILMLYPKYARELLQYRLDTAYVASLNARSTGYKGYRYPWESAFTGMEVTPSCCPEVVEYEQHITGCISFAVRQYLAATRDEDWLKHGGCSIVSNIADFWASRAVINYNTGLYDISNVMGPDEDHFNVTNSVFTNVVAGYSLYLAQYVSCLCKAYYMAKDPGHWADIAWGLALPYDEELDYHPQFEGYQRGTIIKQADAVLLGFPLQYKMNRSSMSNDVRYYGEVTRADGPAMTWSMHAVLQRMLEQDDDAAVLFNRSYTPYVREPFKVWSEVQRPDVGAVNFLTGMGGMLQAVTFGYGGLRLSLDKLELDRPQPLPASTKLTIRGTTYIVVTPLFLTGMDGLLQAVTFGYGGLRLSLDKLELDCPQPLPASTKLTIRGTTYIVVTPLFLTGMDGLLQAVTFGYGGLRLSLDKLELDRPQPLPASTKLTIRGIKYLGANLTLEVEHESCTLTVNSLQGEYPLTLYNGKYNVTLVPDMSVTLSGGGPFTIQAGAWKQCAPPADSIGHNSLRPATPSDI